MGGCRCTYRNCKSRSDGRKTHLFHYPVFDKLRCQQWIINARRFEFLNLTVSQLKNRVVCQHHFQDDAFMNCMNNRLKYDAIPTENGPYCSYDKESKEHAEAVSDLPLTADDVENIETMCTTEKKDIFPVKYVDFLTDGVQTDINEYTTKKKEYITIDIDLKKSYLKNETDTKSFQESADIKKKIKIKQTDLKSFQECADISKNNKSINLQENVVDTTTTINDKSKPIINDKSISTNNNKKALNNNKKVKILSQKIISGSIKLDISGNIVESFTQSQNEQKNNADIFDVNISEVQPDNINTNIIKKEEFNNGNNSSIKVANPTLKQNPIEKNKPSQKTNHLTPEKIAAIQEKRNFNMKLRDIITSGLNKINDINNIGLKIEEKNSTTKIGGTRKNIDNNAFINLKKQMQIMETNLIKKVEQNSNQILAMKNLLHLANDTNDDSLMRKKKSTQTSYSQEEHKQYLFKELSGLVSENLKNQLYEELFIKDEESNSPKRPKRRK